MPACRRAGAVSSELDELEVVRNGRGAGEVGEEDEARLQRGDEERLPPVVVACDVVSELGDAACDLVGREIDVADPPVGR